ncbi:MAG: dTDP-4-dehydrorhamnose 3,5-epimerase [archaeon]|nr:dTDP-4-dehydrorhamnose 3,5-epimerase [archaeon]
MKKVATELKEVFIIEPEVFNDNRGFFLESYSQKKFKDIGIDIKFVQDNHSKSQKNTVRGLHFQSYPGQDKLIRCTKGKIWDVIVDIRPNSPQFKKWIGIEITSDNFLQIFIPIGYAHGFSVLSDYAEMQYKTSNYYDASLEQTIQWNDSEINVDWKVSEPILSKRDISALNLKEFLEKKPDPFK